MAKTKKRKSALPRVTLLAYSRRDLLAFTEAVESLRHLVTDLRGLVEKMKRPPARKAKPTKKATAALVAAAEAAGAEAAECVLAMEGK